MSHETRTKCACNRTLYVDVYTPRGIVKMKINRLKKIKRNLEYYKRNFGVREPYQILGEPI